MEKLDRSTQFSIYSNKGGIIVKEEVSSEKAFTKAVKEICSINSELISTRPLMERNPTVNFDHSVVDGVLAIERAREPALKDLTGSSVVEVSQTTMDEGDEVAPNSPKTTPTNEADSNTVRNATDSFNAPPNASLNDTKSTNNDDDNTESKKSDTGTGFGTDTGTGEKPVSPSKEKSPNQIASPTNSASVPSTPNSPIPYSDCISNRSDSTSTSNRSFAFPVLQREWISSPVKMENSGRSNSRKSRGCSAFFCCN